MRICFKVPMYTPSMFVRQGRKFFSSIFSLYLILVLKVLVPIASVFKAFWWKNISPQIWEGRRFSDLGIFLASNTDQIQNRKKLKGRCLHVKWRACHIIVFFLIAALSLLLCFTTQTLSPASRKSPAWLSQHSHYVLFPCLNLLLHSTILAAQELKQWHIQ